MIGIIPGTILFCALGALAGDVARFGEVLSGETSPAGWGLRVVEFWPLWRWCGLSAERPGGPWRLDRIGLSADRDSVGGVAQSRDQHKPEQAQSGDRAGPG